jgi:hypothetical protein
MLLPNDEDIINFHNSFIYNDIEGFDIVHKHKSKFHKFIGKIIPRWLTMSTMLFPKVYMSYTDDEIAQYPRAYLRVLQHEWVHLKDAQTFFGLLPSKLKWLNAILFHISYLLPQFLTIIALLGFVNPLFFLFLVFALPIPSPIRMWTEVRAYRRSYELGANLDKIIAHFTTSSYYFMWPFKKHITKLITKKSSPYKHQMDVAWKLSTGEII